LNPDWHLLGTLNWSQTEGAANSTLHATYHEIVFGAAWRPLANGRWNILAEFTILDDQPSAVQIDASGNTVQYASRAASPTSTPPPDDRLARARGRVRDPDRRAEADRDGRDLVRERD
jgi:hypothetical protein